MKGIIIDWPGTLASIPTDWLLCDGNNSTPNMLGKYALSVGASEDPGATGGSTTHTHSSTAHGHTQNTHSHTNTSGTGGNTKTGQEGSTTVAHGGHTHTGTTSSDIATNQTNAITTDTASNDPPFHKVAPIIDNSIAGVKYPISSLILWFQTTLPLGWSLCDGTGGIEDLRGKFLKYVNAAENPGATGGSATHTHTPNSHTHTQNGHTHSGTSDGPSATNVCAQVSPSNSVAGSSHTHSLSAASTVAVNQNSDVTLDTVNGEPTFKKLLIIKNTGVANRPKYAIVKWSGTIANIPLGYVLCDGNNGTPNMLDYFVKGATNSGELENTGGSSVHNHTASSHNHTQNSHTHTITMGYSGEQNIAYLGSARSLIGQHIHSDFTSNAATATNQATTITISNCSSQANYPPYYKVAYIMQDRDLDAGAYAILV